MPTGYIKMHSDHLTMQLNSIRVHQQLNHPSFAMAAVSLTHIPALFVGTAFVLGGGLPFWSAESAMRHFGLPAGRAAQEPAQAVFPIYGSRVQIHGLCIWIFYLQGNLAVVDTLLAVLVYAGMVDWWICRREGVPGRGGSWAGWRLERGARSA